MYSLFYTIDISEISRGFDFQKYTISISNHQSGYIDHRHCEKNIIYNYYETFIFYIPKNYNKYSSFIKNWYQYTLYNLDCFF